MLSPDPATVHIVGGGLAGLAAAVRLCDSAHRIVIYEATAQPGGRCRSFRDPTTGMMIDNGTHILFSGNHAALSYLREIGAEHRLEGPDTAEFPFIDMATGARWSIRLSNGLIPWWIFDKRRRVPETAALDYLRLARLAWMSTDIPLSKAIKCDGPLYQRLLAPFFLAALNVEPRDGSTQLAAAVLRETLINGGKACRPLMARSGIGEAFIDPAIELLRGHGVQISFGHELHALRFGFGRVNGLDFGGRIVDLDPRDNVILAVPAYAAAKLVPDLPAPSSFRAIVNAHFCIDPPGHAPHMLGVINGTIEWIFAFPGRVAVTISDADHLIDTPRTMLAKIIWAELAKVLRLPRELPRWQIVRERRATFAATPEQNAKRPPSKTKWSNLVLAGDWTATGLPATLEGAVRSGHRAAALVRSERMAAA
jgi:squalene-associated FAD-dependent desaturase